MKKTFIYGTILLVLILLMSFSFIFFKTFTKESVSAIISLKKRYLLLSGLFLFLYHTFDNIRLYLLSRAVGLHYSFRYGYTMSLINTFGATVTPAHAGGELAAIYMLLRKGASVHKVMSIVTMKTISGITFFVVAFPFLIHQFIENPSFIKPVLEMLIVVFLGAGIIYIIINYLFRKNAGKASIRKLRDILKKYFYYLKIFGYKKKTYFLLASLSSIMLYLCFLMIAPALILSFGGDGGFVETVKAQLGLLYAIFVSPTPGGSGVGEIGGLLVFSGFLEAHQVGVFVIIWRLIGQYISALLGGVLFVLYLLKDLRT